MSNPVAGTLGGLREGAQAIGRASHRDPVELDKLYERLKLAEISRVPYEALDALAARVAEAPAKIAAAKAKGAEPKKVKAAELKLAQLQDEHSRAIRREAEWYALNALYVIGRDFLGRLRPALADAVAPTVSISIPGLVTATLALDGPDDEPPF